MLLRLDIVVTRLTGLLNCSICVSTTIQKRRTLGLCWKTPSSVNHCLNHPPYVTRSMAALNILCIGDSLTAGSTAGTEHPYAQRLKSRLEQAFPDHEIDCQVEGKHGDQVTQGGFEERIEAACKTICCSTSILLYVESLKPPTARVHRRQAVRLYSSPRRF